MVTSSVPQDTCDSLLVLFVATLAIRDPAKQVFATAKEFTPDLSRIIYIGKMAWAVGELNQIEQECASEEIRDSLCQTGKTIDDYKARRFADEYTRSLGADAMFNIGLLWLRSLRLLGKKIAADTDGKARLAWARDGKCLFLDEHHIKIDDVKRLMQFTISEVQRTWEPLVKRSPLPMNLDLFSLEELVDSPANTSPGFWFGMMSQNSHLLDIHAYANSLLPGFVRAVRVGAAEDGQRKPSLDDSAVDSFLALEQVWLFKLLLFIHLCSGMPARISELTEATVINGIGGRPRSFTLSPGGEVTLDLIYHKTEWASNRLRHNTTILHPLAGRMLTFYMCTVMPLTNTLLRLRHGVERTYLWSAPASKDEKTVSKISHAQVIRELGYLCGASGLGFMLNISEWRHFAKAVAHK